MASICVAGNPAGGRIGSAVVLVYTDDDVAATQVVKIIGKRTHGVQHGFRVPTGFKLQPLPLDRAGGEKVVYVDGKVHDILLPFC